jgi:hypothetical protein
MFVVLGGRSANHSVDGEQFGEVGSWFWMSLARSGFATGKNRKLAETKCKPVGANEMDMWGFALTWLLTWMFSWHLNWQIALRSLLRCC